MKRFVSYMTESADATNAFLRAREISSIIPTPKRRELFGEAIDKLIIAANSKSIYKARFAEHKRSMMWGIEYAYAELVKKHSDRWREDKVVSTDAWGMSSIAEITRIAKIFDKIGPKYPEITSFIANIRDIPSALKVVSSYEIAGKPPKEPAPGQFVKPMASFQATKLAAQYMNDAVATFRLGFETDVRKSTMETFEKIKDITDPKLLPTTGSAITIASQIFVVRGFGKQKSFELLKDADARVERYIRHTVDDTIGQFVGKNTSKIASIFEKKSGIKSHEILSTNIRNGMVENRMRFTFDDNSSFILYSQVIYKQSPMGKMFVQFPTRFTDVVMPDGSKMSGPSEEKMIKQF
jgi:hypothetical protein